jgi:large subunit ribosomal protein L30
MAKKLLVKQIKSGIGTLPKQRATLKALGLRKISAERVHDDNAVVRGMIDKVNHLVSVKEIDH